MIKSIFLNIIYRQDDEFSQSSIHSSISDLANDITTKYPIEELPPDFAEAKVWELFCSELLRLLTHLYSYTDRKRPNL